MESNGAMQLYANHHHVLSPSHHYDAVESIHRHAMDEKPNFFDTSEPCNMKHGNYVIRYPESAMASSEHNLNLVKLQTPSSPIDKYTPIDYQLSAGGLCMPTSSISLHSMTPNIKYCGSSLAENSSRKMNNISPTSSSSSTVPHIGLSQTMNRPMDMPTGYSQNSTPIETMTVSKTSNQSNDQTSNAPDTTKKTTGGRRPEKPPLSYINMIAIAIKESNDRKCTLSEIYKHLESR